MKTSSWTRLLAFVLVLAMMFQMLPAQALALDGVNSAANQEDEPDGEEPYSLTVLGEVESLREEKIKHFRLSDGSFVAVSYGMPVHYQDSDGQWQDIDNSLLLEAESLETANECAPAAFSRDLAEGEIFTASQGDYSVSMSLLDTVESVALTAEKANAKADMTGLTAPVEDRIYDRTVEAAVTDEVPTMLQLQEKYVWDVNDVIPEKLQSSLVYREVFPGIDLLYTAFGYNIKEQIVVNEPQSAYRFDFLLETDGLSAVLNSDGSMSFLDEDGEAHYEIPAPYMVDAAGVYSDRVSYTLGEDARGYVLTVEADEEWINDEEREFPVNIDPTLAVVSGQALQDIYSVYTMEAAPNDTTLGRQWLYVGAQPYSTSNDGRYRIYMHFQNMPAIPSGSEVVHADLSLYKTAYTQRYCPQFPIGAYKEVAWEISAQSTAFHYGQAFSITYPAHSETVYRDSGEDRIPGNDDDLTTHYLFDYAGRTVNAYTTDNDGNILGASNAVYTNNSGTDRKNNRTERTATIGIAGQQLLKNSGVETTENPWSSSAGVSVSTEKPRTGAKGIKGTSTEAVTQAAYHKTEELVAGKTYTFSCFVNTSAITSFVESGVFVWVYDGQGNQYIGQRLRYATDPSIDGGWIRLSVSFTPKVSGVHYCSVYNDKAIGTFYADDFQLEEGEAPSTFNLVENGSMEMTGHGWTMGTNAGFASGGVANSSGSLQILGDPEESGTNAYQDIPLNLPASQTYVLSGWAKANAVPDSPEELNSPDDVTKKCGLRATIYYTDGTTEGHYVPFNSDISNQWQFTSTTIVPKKATGTVEKIRVTLAYEGNANTCFFDNISLLREVAQTMRYDADGNLESVTTSGLAEDTNTYANGNLIQTVTGGNGTFTFNYDTANTHRLNSVTNGQITQSMGYDASGNVISSTLSGTGGKSIQTSAVYQGSQNRITSSTDAAGNETKYYYADGNVQMRALPTTIIDPKGIHHTASYDASGRIVQTAVANAASLQYNYEKGNLSSVQRTNNGKSQTYSFSYDSFGNMLSAMVGNRILANNVYANGNGLLTKQVYGNGVEINFTYDTLGRKKTATYPDGRVLSYVYNGEGQLHSLTETNGSSVTTYLYTYDSIGRLIYSEQKEGYTSVLRTSQNYNTNNQLTSQNWQLNGAAYSEGYTYNSSDGSLNTMTTGVGTTLTMGYDGLRRLTSVTGGPVSRQYTYRDIDSTKTTMQVASVTSGGQQYSYTYDSMGNIATYSAPGKGTVTYTYDNQGQLLKAVGDTTYTYTYDGAGNILTANGHTYTYGDANWKDLLTAFDGQSIAYDSIGNPLSYYNGTRWNFTWANGRSLATASDGTTSLSFAYDASGLRTSKTVNGTTYRYYYAGGKLMRMTWDTNTIDFFYDANGAPYAMKYNGTVYYYVTNLQGDVMRIVNASGTVVASYDYDPYGKVISATGTLANVNPLRYRGYVYDQETGFYYLQSRYYDPAIGRFLNADSYASTGQGIIGSNMLAYCSNNPINSCDTTGKLAVASYSIGTAIDFLLDVTINQLVRVTASAMNQLVEEAKIAYARTSKAIRSYAKACIDEYVELLKKSLPCVHHIVPPGEFSNRADRTQQHLQEMREILIDAGINPEKDWINQVSVSQGFHASLHTNLYIEYLYKDLKKASGDKDQVKLVLYWYRIMITAADPYSAGY